MSDDGPSNLTDRQFTITFTSRNTNNVKIPKMVMRRHLQGNLPHRYVVLSCGVKPGLIWAVDIVGRKLTGGWTRFVEDNSFEDGDMLLFEYRGDWRFHVDRNRPNIGNTQDNDAMGDEAQFVTLTVTADKLEKSIMFLPQCFYEANGLFQFAGQNIYMVGEDGMMFPVKLNLGLFPAVQRLRLGQGLREFFEANDEITMQLAWDRNTPILALRISF